ncbi:MAG: hypothetical protein ABJA77_17085 [Variovorax sp.]
MQRLAVQIGRAAVADEAEVASVLQEAAAWLGRPWLRLDCVADRAALRTLYEIRLQPAQRGVQRSGVFCAI